MIISNLSKMVKIHKLSDVQSNNIGAETSIWQFCVILQNSVIGKNCNICAQVFIENDVFIGDNVTIKPGVQIWDGITIEDNVFVGPNVTFTNDLVPRSKQYPERFIRTVVKKGVTIGANSTIIAGITLGEFCFIGAGSVVTKNTTAYQVYYGNPARHSGYITAEGTIISLELRDKMGNIYRLENGMPTLIS